MANSLFPLSVPVFVDHRDLLDDVNAEHVNYLQREVNAIARVLGVNPQVHPDRGSGSSQGSTVLAGTDYGTVAARLNALEKSSGSTRFVGEVAATLGNTAEPGWLMLHGQTYNPVEYPELYAKINTATLPDFRNRSPRGGVGQTGLTLGSDAILIRNNQLPAHNHGLTTTRNENSGQESGDLGGGGIGYGWALGKKIGVPSIVVGSNATELHPGFQDRVVVYNPDVYRPRPYAAATALQHFDTQQQTTVTSPSVTVNFMVRAAVSD